MAPSWEQITEAVIVFVDARSAAEAKQILENHRNSLLTDAADAVLAYLELPPIGEYCMYQGAVGRLLNHSEHC